MGNRQFTRIRYESGATVKEGGCAFPALTANLSLTGIYLRTERHFPVGKRVEISFDLPSASYGSTVTVNGVVVRNDVHGLALQFKSVDEDSFVHLKSVINRKTSNRLKPFFNA
jgi:Tfp pilus assembly protein PilZ